MNRQTNTTKNITCFAKEVMIQKKRPRVDDTGLKVGRGDKGLRDSQGVNRMEEKSARG